MALQPSQTGVSSVTFEQQVRAKIETLTYLPTTVAVAMKFMELGRDPESGPNEYSKVISSDASLSSKLLSLANSSWFGVRNKVTKVNVAVNLLGLSTIRTLAVGYCLAGIHNNLRLPPEDSQRFWSASLYKAVVARQYATVHDPSLAEEAFAAGLFQDFALPIMFAVDRVRMSMLLVDGELDSAQRIDRERSLFQLDHAELARCLAQKLQLPQLFVDSVAFHHNQEQLKELLGNRVLAEAIHLASLFPHSLETWNARDAGTLQKLLEEQKLNLGICSEGFLQGVQREFNQLYGYFEQGQAPEVDLPALLEGAASEAADNTTRLVANVQSLLQEAVGAGREMQALLQQQEQLAEAAIRDPLTGALNREGFTTRGTAAIALASRYASGFAVAYFDVDKFKEINDTAGHAGGDRALQWVVTTITRNLRDTDIVARLGGDEFAAIIPDRAEIDAVAIVERIIASIAAGDPEAVPGAPRMTISAGLITVPPRHPISSLSDLVAAADRLMYQSKRTGGGQLTWLSVTTVGRSAA